MLVVNNIDVFYGAIQVLYDVSLKVNQGEIVFLGGQNSAGKTTTIKTIIGLLHPKDGSIEYQGSRIDNLSAHEIVRRGIACLLEGKRVFPYLSVLENLQIAATTPEAKEKFSETLEEVYELFPILKERKKQLAGTLSGGEQQMLAIARSLILRPKLCIFDEISLGLSPILTAQLYKVIEKLKSRGLTLLLVDQNIRRALHICDRLYVMRKGRIVWEGLREEAKEDEIKKAYFGLQ
ncbi:MAG: ABC transporter ATP-binding protein [Thaumarchaeota archaeon]|jgi:branched-chain amino acid transport system ATP-binding protein|nr:ABC transporter ATP-binding protein [Nitrososphaerota archaeon]